MAELKVNSFSEYDLTSEETLRGSVLNELQRQVMQNHLAAYSEQKNALDIDPEHPLAFIQDESKLKGIIEILNYLMDTSEVSLELLEQHTTIEE